MGPIFHSPCTCGFGQPSLGTGWGSRIGRCFLLCFGVVRVVRFRLFLHTLGRFKIYCKFRKICCIEEREAACVWGGGGEMMDDEKSDEMQS